MAPEDVEETKGPPRSPDELIGAVKQRGKMEDMASMEYRYDDPNQPNDQVEAGGPAEDAKEAELIPVADGNLVTPAPVKPSKSSVSSSGKKSGARRASWSAEAS